MRNIFRVWQSWESVREASMLRALVPAGSLSQASGKRFAAQ